MNFSIASEQQFLQGTTLRELDFSFLSFHKLFVIQTNLKHWSKALGPIIAVGLWVDRLSLVQHIQAYVL